MATNQPPSQGKIDEARARLAALLPVWAATPNDQKVQTASTLGASGAALLKLSAAETLSPKQLVYLGDMLFTLYKHRPEASHLRTAEVQLMLHSILRMFEEAPEGTEGQGKRAMLRSPNGETVKCTQPHASNTRYPGCVHITVREGEHGEFVYAGRIQQTGLFQRAGGSPDWIELLRTVDADVQGSVSNYGHATGQCGFCGRVLENGVSVRLGYGPVCAEKYGLPWE